MIAISFHGVFGLISLSSALLIFRQNNNISKITDPPFDAYSAFQTDKTQSKKRSPLFEPQSYITNTYMLDYI
jgi:hypothetical protein